MNSDLESRMNMILEKMGIPLKVLYLPNDDPREHSKIDLENNLILIYDESEDEAMRSLFHEILEFRIRGLLKPYRKIINSLIETIEKLVYIEKEKVLDQVMNDFSVWRELWDFPAPAELRREKHGRG